MKCLSVCQPFADLIVRGKKTIELRKWNTGYRGEFLVHAPIKVMTDDCKRLKFSEKLITGAIIGKAELYGVKKYESNIDVKADKMFHLSAKEFRGKTFGFLLRNPKQFRIPIPIKGRLGLFDADLPKSKIKDKDLLADIIDEEFRYQWIGHH